jgi:transcriptional regulator with XRE-family HTH domain
MARRPEQLKHHVRAAPSFSANPAALQLPPCVNAQSSGTLETEAHMTHKNAKQLGEFIRQKRLEIPLSQEKLAERAKMPHSTISRIESGEFEQPRPDKLQRLAAALDIAVEDLYALAGYTTAEALPEFQVYLRTKLAGELPPKARKELEAYYETLRSRYGEKGGPRAKRRR